MQDLRLFSDVARCHSISLAAEMHGITQSAVSQRINQLEKRLGVSLLDRTVRPLELTEAGQVFLAGVGEVLQRYDRLERAVMARAQSPSGVVRVSAIYSSGIDLLQQASESFEKRWPDVTVQIAYEKPDAVYDAVMQGRADLGLLSYPERFKKVGVIALRDEEMAVVCPPSHALAGRASVEAVELSGQEMVSFDTDLPVGRRVVQYLKAQGASPITAHSFDNLDTIKSAVAATDRFAILPKRTVRHEVEAGTLAVVGLAPRLVRPMGLITRRPSKHEAALPSATAVFVDFLTHHAGQLEPGSQVAPEPVASPIALDSSPATTPADAASAPLVGAKR